jgi:phosphopantothenoylcysteine decarboxylase/phosphopantothenate--cysteine ligase
VAEAGARRGARVVLVSGPTALETPPAVERVDVRSAQDMHRAVLERLPQSSIAIFAAAVADYRPADTNSQKIKRSGEGLTLRLEPTPDILAEAARNHGDRVIVGFAAETERVAENARKKLAEKNADLIVANDVTAEGAGFDGDTNVVTLFSRDGRDLPLPKLTKQEVADRILDEVLRLRSVLRKVARGSAR